MLAESLIGLILVQFSKAKFCLALSVLIDFDYLVPAGTHHGVTPLRAKWAVYVN
jgi:hypothetical protein